MAPVAQATVPDGTYFFMDNKGYNDKQEQVFFCLGITSQTCYTIESEFAFTRDIKVKVDEVSNKVDQLNQKIDQLQNTVNQLQQPAASIPVGGSDIPVVVDSTAPKLLVVRSTEQSPITYCGSGFACPTNLSDKIKQFKLQTPTDTYLSFATNELTTAVAYFYKETGVIPATATSSALHVFGEPVSLNDFNLSDIHNISYSSMDRGGRYKVSIELTDAAGNKSNQDNAIIFTYSTY